MQKNAPLAYASMRRKFRRTKTRRKCSQMQQTRARATKTAPPKTRKKSWARAGAAYAARALSPMGSLRDLYFVASSIRRCAALPCSGLCTSLCKSYAHGYVAHTRTPEASQKCYCLEFPCAMHTQSPFEKLPMQPRLHEIRQVKIPLVHGINQASHSSN